MFLPGFCISNVAVCRSIFCHVPDRLKVSAAKASALKRKDAASGCVQDGEPVELMFASALASILWLGATSTPGCTCSHIALQNNRSDDVVFLLDESDASKTNDTLGTGRFDLDSVGDYVEKNRWWTLTRAWRWCTSIASLASIGQLWQLTICISNGTHDRR
jgi:hypothetical protein